MPIQQIDNGDFPNDPLADPLRVGAERINENFALVDENVKNTKSVSFGVVPNPDNIQVADKINQLPGFTITEKQIILFKAFYGVITDDLLISLRVKKYHFLNYGKGNYGQGGTQINSLDLELFYQTVATSQDIFQDESTQVIEYTLPNGQAQTPANVSNWLNTRPNPYQAVQSQDEGLRVFRSGDITFLFTGDGGLYGTGQDESDASEFLQFNAPDEVPEPVDIPANIVLYYKYIAQETNDKFQFNFLIDADLIEITKNNLITQESSVQFDPSQGTVSGFYFEQGEQIIIKYSKQ